MQEAQRRQYLRALGVPCLVPRFVLPGAAPSRRCALPEMAPDHGADADARPRDSLSPQHSPQAPSQQPAPTPEPPQPSAPRPSRLPQIEIEPARREPAKPPPAKRAAATPAGFELTLCRAADWLVVDAGGEPSALYLSLLGSLLRAAGGGEVNSEGRGFRWPLEHHPTLDASAEGGIEVLRHHLQTLHERQAAGRLLLLGAQTAERVGEPLPVTTLALPESLWEALSEGEVKRRLWLQLAAAGWL